ncbi:hypothetical protein SO3561_08992 [Streptomyces olivochromogenes]|uniref:Uncharacterized protein n=1 Tax=Streptomyces olivochromogenes TaxID=1963 RepID=A0A250VTR5_STROL|nr:hypothetical protein SO3561_08992 [Streptomyces olivochromogenes]
MVVHRGRFFEQLAFLGGDFDPAGASARRIAAAYALALALYTQAQALQAVDGLARRSDVEGERVGDVLDLAGGSCTATVRRARRPFRGQRSGLNRPSPPHIPIPHPPRAMRGVLRPTSR